MDHMNDLTNGKVSGKLLSFFFPMLLTNLLQQIYSVADTAIVGRGLGDNALGAVGNLSSVINPNGDLSLHSYSNALRLSGSALSRNL